jgi:hypothetical protein
LFCNTYRLAGVASPSLRVCTLSSSPIAWFSCRLIITSYRNSLSRSDCATWLHKARSLPKDQFKQEVEKELRGRETEPWEIIYFKLYNTQIPVVEQAIETAALMLGTDKSRGYWSGDDLRGLSGRSEPGQ